MNYDHHSCKNCRYFLSDSHGAVCNAFHLIEGIDHSERNDCQDFEAYISRESYQEIIDDYIIAARRLSMDGFLKYLLNLPKTHIRILAETYLD